jgi:hypothetical protein
MIQLIKMIEFSDTLSWLMLVWHRQVGHRFRNQQQRGSAGVDAVNAIIHLFAAAGFGWLGFLYIQEQRKSRRILALARWTLRPETAPSHISAKLGEVLQDLCQVLGVPFDSSETRLSPPQVIGVKYWIELLISGRVNAVEIRRANGRDEIEVKTNEELRLTDDQRKYFASADKFFVVIFRPRGEI